MLLLALDTSAAVSAAVHDGERVLAERTTHDPRRHAELLVPSIDEVLAEAGRRRGDVSAIAVGVGPGPFTGLRVGLVTARTLGLALGVPVHGVCSLDALALQAVRAADLNGTALNGDLLVATDARRREVYWARYSAPHPGGSDDGLPLRVAGPEVARPAAVPVDGARCVGRGALLYAEHLPGAGEPPDAGPLDPQAGAVADVVAVRLAAGGAGLLPPDPLYLRRPDATPAGERKRVTP